MMREGGEESERGSMPIHFSKEEFAGRQRAAAEAAAAAGFDGLLVFKQESMFYLTGYDTFGFCFFQCLWLGADGRMALLTRAPDLRQAEFTSVLEDIRIWEDAADARPELDLKAMLAEFGVGGGRLGVEWQAYGLRPPSASACAMRWKGSSNWATLPGWWTGCASSRARRNSTMCARQASWQTALMTKRCGWRAPARSKATSWPRCRGRSGGQEATNRRTRPSSAPAPRTHVPLLQRDAGIWVRTTS